MKLYATLETSRGKQVSISDNEQIIATVYDGNMKAYSVIIEWQNIGDPEGSETEGGKPSYGSIVTTREWRNRTKTNDKKPMICADRACINKAHRHSWQR